MWVGKYTCVRVFEYTRVCMCVRVRVCKYTRVRACVRACMRRMVCGFAVIPVVFEGNNLICRVRVQA